jgi:hypothetical protein
VPTNRTVGSFRRYPRGGSIYSFQLSEGTRTHYNYFVHSQGQFTSPDGKTIPIKDSEHDTCFAEWGLTSPLGSGAPSLT